MEFGLIAKKLGHSFSAEIHELIDSYSYELLEIEEIDLESFFRKRDFRGINVTIPYKQTVIPFLDELDAAAEKIGAVNTIVNRDGRLIGYNTDFGGMISLISRLNIDLSGRKVLILGTGGTSKTAAAVAGSLGARETVRVSRSPDKGSVSYEEAVTAHGDAQIIINATPCGMFPKLDDCPIDISCFECLEGVIDAIFNPLRSELVMSALKKGVRTEGGLYMLVAQAVLAAGHFTGKKYGSGTVDRVFREVYRMRSNIVLTGMPGCGKTTLGKLISEKTGRKFIDLDSEIEKHTGMKVPEIFAKYGEEHFRNAESEVTDIISAETGAVIATGGGCVLRGGNVDRLKQNGRIVFIDTPPDLLVPTDWRPLADSISKIKALYEARRGIYDSTADLKVDRTGSAGETAAIIMSSMGEGS
ncbi:MAG: AAA family ATPase [Clostridia bacterium]|nr:AAA family ATPase [Clostridia bacterium]